MIEHDRPLPGRINAHLALHAPAGELTYMELLQENQDLLNRYHEAEEQIKGLKRRIENLQRQLGGRTNTR